MLRRISSGLPNVPWPKPLASFDQHAGVIEALLLAQRMSGRPLVRHPPSALYDSSLALCRCKIEAVGASELHVFWIEPDLGHCGEYARPSRVRHRSNSGRSGVSTVHKLLAFHLGELEFRQVLR